MSSEKNCRQPFRIFLSIKIQYKNFKLELLINKVLEKQEKKNKD